MWLDLLKDYDIMISYHSGKDNIVVDTLIRTMVGMGSLALMVNKKRPLVMDA